MNGPDQAADDPATVDTLSFKELRNLSPQITVPQSTRSSWKSRTEPYLRSETSAGLPQIVGRLLAPDPMDRYASALDVLHDLNRTTGRELRLETIVTRESFLQTPELVGRDEELNRLCVALDAAGDGRGSTWFVSGESGLGKSRLLSELRTLALVRGAPVMSGQAVAEGGRFFQVWMPVLRSLCLRVDPPDFEASVLKPLVPELPTLLSRSIPDAAQLSPKDALSRLFKAVAGLLRMQDRVAVILLEDLQWADADSLQLLAHLSVCACQTRLLIIGSYRHEEAPALPDGIPEATLLKLRPLDRIGCIRLTASLCETLSDKPEVMEYLYRQSEGNVFFLIEIIREFADRAGRLDLIDQVPRPEHLLTGGIARVMRRRIARVPEGDRPLLTLAAIVGREVDFSILQALAPEFDLSKWLLRSSNAGILERQAERWRFAHDQLREAILTDIPPNERSRAHGLVARAIESAYAGSSREERSASLAYHFELAGEAEKSSFYSLQAGDIATRLCAYGEARQHYTAALRAADRLSMTDANRRNQIDTLLKLVYTCFVSDSAEENFSRVIKARSLLDGLGDQELFSHEDKLRLARIESAKGRIHFYRGDIAEAINHYRRVLPIAETSGDEELLALSSCLIGTALLVQGHMLEAAPLLAQAVAPLEHLGEPFEWFRAAGYHGASLIATGRYEEGVARLASVVARAKEIDQPSILSAAYLMRGSAYLFSGDWPLVIDNLEEVVELANITGDKLHMSLAWSGIGWARSHMGSVKEAGICRRKGVDIAQAMGGRLMLEDWYQAADAEMCLHSGELGLALHLAEAVADQSRGAGRLFSLGIAERVQGEVLAQYAHSSEADRHMRNSVAALEEGGMVLQADLSRANWAVQLRRRGSGDDAQHLFHQVQGRFERVGCAFALSELRRLEAQDN
ncbi:MAG: AAA family ATPase [Acidobacteriaceae bacterium]|nr:AAA family ATPase [Acidobacteriaceae bacterium]